MPYVELVKKMTYEVGWQEMDVSKYVTVTRVLFDGVNEQPFSHTTVYSSDLNLPSAKLAAEEAVQDAIDDFTA